MVVCSNWKWESSVAFAGLFVKIIMPFLAEKFLLKEALIYCCCYYFVAYSGMKKTNFKIHLLHLTKACSFRL